ncbi:copper/zinc superoxide dismutase [Ancylostoma caninum]|uniref:Superoxide dismutase [Cu-Zn] n=1 Tax=Ancylostoma caninum TaxID=29170 RepID=A0A368FUF2_ANCCA|nr:copper/zinc superoxide dismutase [Ancylostoma caninum]
MFLEILLLFAVIHSSTNCQGGGRPPSQVTRARAIIFRAVPGGNPTMRIGSITFRQSGRTVTASGDTVIDITDNVISLTGPQSIVGRAIVIHADPDDLNRGNAPTSNTTGNSGARVACGVIRLI